ncbi:hypothetical protein E2493_10700 [Sphingomonas parva]|uniref:Lipoprotein n=1 Tax=Sphingomonas parva TaxID=2555898 RepID=A0A4Y8ZQF6_9SPHN|nr:hypothetical protein [Sphingomonas parva]TFI58251.1 hypothetical protein E2493_10700 [Sphingomonas parva]
MRILLALPLVLLAGCNDTLPLALQNQSKASMTVTFTSKDGKCDSAKPESLAPSERLLVKCAAADLTGVDITMADGRNCALTPADISRLVQERKGMKGSFMLPLGGC